ncbi:caspase-8-like [Vespa mandarinia]|uniref:caspase-8-like n=1 Tax=Vespa mandarinia TaxID=7446 RepID=UPI0016156027|nr:caspase-8-like [Vespa mandarinia]
MSLVSDARPPRVDATPNVIKNRINLNILEKIESDLDIDDIVSILFLMVNDYKSVFLKIFKLYCKAKKYKTSVIAEIVKDNEENWEEKLLESICISENRKVIKKLGLRYEDLEKSYLPKCRLYTKKLNPIAKCLYLLCESLSVEETKRLLRFVKEDKIFLSIINENKKYEPILEDIDQLELHLLYWMNIGYISIFSAKEGNLKNLLKHLKGFDDIDYLIMEDLKACNRDQNISSLSASKETPRSLENQINVIEIENNMRKIKKGLCIIINQIYFYGSQYETRLGTSADADKLSKTFRGLGFTVSVIDNLTKHKMLSHIRDLSKQFGCDYDCIFLCILSHGCEGGIIAVDEKEVSIKSINNAFCCSEFSKIIKIVIIQACQGKAIGKVLNLNPLTTDGLDEPATIDITAHANFCVFMSTLQGFVSIRDKLRGSWFIQELCNILQRNERKISFFELTTKVIQTIRNKQGIMDGDRIAQLPELFMCRLDADFELPKYNP